MSTTSSVLEAVEQTTPPLSVRRGSTWAKWDMHVHTPCSALNNQFPKLATNGGPDWEPYISALEKLQGYAAIAVADYFEIEGYKKILGFRAQGRLQNIALDRKSTRLNSSHANISYA